jgi:hypothetical protein
MLMHAACGCLVKRARCAFRGCADVQEKAQSVDPGSAALTYTCVPPPLHQHTLLPCCRRLWQPSCTPASWAIPLYPPAADTGAATRAQPGGVCGDAKLHVETWSVDSDIIVQPDQMQRLPWLHATVCTLQAIGTQAASVLCLRGHLQRLWAIELQGVAGADPDCNPRDPIFRGCACSRCNPKIRASR